VQIIQLNNGKFNFVLRKFAALIAVFLLSKKYSTSAVTFYFLIIKKRTNNWQKTA